jgi:ribosomal protein S12 methylthiotransferase accessory factor
VPDAVGGFLVDDDEVLTPVGEHGLRVLEALGRRGGQVSTDDLMADLRLTAAEVPAVADDLVQLLRAGVLVRTAAGTVPRPAVAVVAVGSCDVGELRDALARSGTPVLEPGAAEDLAGIVVVVCDDHADPRLPAVLRERAERTGVLLVRWGAGRCWIGPFLEPGPAHRTSGSCPDCLLASLQQNAPEGRAGTGEAAAGDPAVRQAAAALVVAALDGLTGVPDEPRTRWRTVVKEVRLRTLDVVEHPVAGCLPPVATGDLVSRTAAHVSALTGVLAPVEVRAVGPRRFLAVTTHPVRGRSGWRRATAFGGGATARAAVTACTGEAVERFSTSWHDEGDAVRTSAEALRRTGARVTTAAQLLHLGPGQPAPEPFPDDACTDYLPLRDVVDGTPLDWWVPAAATTFGHPDRTAAAAARPDSNGCAAGTSVPDAVRRGLQELVERDAVALWWWPQARRPELPLDVLGAAASREFTRELAARGRNGWLLDLTTDLAVPVAVAVSARTDGTGVVLGFGAAASRPAAGGRAAGELLQVLACGDLEEPFRVGSPGSARWQQQDVADLDFLRPHGSVRPWPALGGSAEPDEATVLHRWRRRLAAVGVDVGFLDLTRPNLGVPVVRVVAPQLRPWYRRLGPGRLRLDGPENPWDPPV